MTLLVHIFHIGNLNDRGLRWTSLETPASVPMDSYIKVSSVKVIVCLNKSNKHRKKEIRKTLFLQTQMIRTQKRSLHIKASVPPPTSRKWDKIFQCILLDQRNQGLHFQTYLLNDLHLISSTFLYMLQNHPKLFQNKC